MTVSQLVRVARLNDDRAKSEDIAPSPVGWIDPDRFIAEIKH